jgi:hypothetical protein
MAMNDDDALQALNHALELERQREEEECEHGMPHDSGHQCLECAVDKLEYQQLLKEDPGYTAWVNSLEGDNGQR